MLTNSLTYIWRIGLIAALGFGFIYAANSYSSQVSATVHNTTGVDIYLLQVNPLKLVQGGELRNGDAGSVKFCDAGASQVMRGGWQITCPNLVLTTDADWSDKEGPTSLQCANAIQLSVRYAGDDKPSSSSLYSKSMLYVGPWELGIDTPDECFPNQAWNNAECSTPSCPECEIDLLSGSCM